MFKKVSTSRSWSGNWLLALLLLSFSAFSTSCTPRIVAMPQPCFLEPIPPFPALTWEMCGENLCLSPDEARELVLYTLAIDRWSYDYKRFCNDPYISEE